MKALFIIAAMLVPSLAMAQDKAPKPSVCLSFQLIKSDAGVFAVCHDSGKPSLFRRFEVVEVPGKEAGRVKVLVGWR